MYVARLEVIVGDHGSHSRIQRSTIGCLLATFSSFYSLSPPWPEQ